MKILLSLLLLLAGCRTAPTESRFVSDLYGHSTGGREKAWRFERGQSLTHIKHISTPAPYTHVISLISSAGQGHYLQVLRLEYTPQGRIKVVGQLHIEQLTNSNWSGRIKR